MIIIYSNKRIGTMGVDGDGDDDRVSNLPDDILSYILSFLSMREAVKTRILSRRWRFLSSSSPDLHFDLLSVVGLDYSEEYINPWLFYNKKIDGYESFQEIFSTHKSSFLKGVAQFLRLYNNSKINTFQVTFGLKSDSASHIDQWINFALGRHVATISLEHKYISSRDCYNFPLHLLPPGEASPLKHLHLKYCTLTPSPAHSIRFNSLKTLEISYVRLLKFHLDNIISGCLNLESLMLKECTMLSSGFHILGRLPCLKSLFIFDCWGFGTVQLGSLEKLETFEHGGLGTRFFTFVNLPALENVHLKFADDVHEGFRYAFSKLADDLPNLKNLSLSFDHLELVPESVATFKHLKGLEMCAVFAYDYDFLPIIRILNACPALKKFHLSIHFGGKDFVRTTDGRFEGEHPHLELEEVEIRGFTNRSNEMELIRYLLKSCVSLKKMVVNVMVKAFRGAGSWGQHQPYNLAPSWDEVCNLLQSQRLSSNVEIVVC